MSFLTGIVSTIQNCLYSLIRTPSDQLSSKLHPRCSKTFFDIAAKLNLTSSNNTVKIIQWFEGKDDVSSKNPEDLEKGIGAMIDDLNSICTCSDSKFGIDRWSIFPSTGDPAIDKLGIPIIIGRMRGITRHSLPKDVKKNYFFLALHTKTGEIRDSHFISVMLQSQKDRVEYYARICADGCLRPEDTFDS